MRILFLNSFNNPNNSNQKSDSNENFGNRSDQRVTCEIVRNQTIDNQDDCGKHYQQPHRVSRFSSRHINLSRIFPCILSRQKGGVNHNNTLPVMVHMEAIYR